MTLARLVPLQLHAAIEALLAPALIVGPFLLGLSSAAVVCGVVIGALLMGSALQASAKTPRVSIHVGTDMLIGALIAGVAIGFAVVGQPLAAILFGAIAAVEMLLFSTTRYSTTAG